MESIKQKLALFLASKRHSSFVWGQNDCHTLVLETHDHLYGTNYLADLYKKYDNQRGAYQLAKTWDAEQQMQFMGYDEVATMRDGDVVLVKEKHGYSSSVVLQRTLYTIYPDRGLCTISTSAFRDAHTEYTIWRMTNGS